jgi:hypothetical protein
MSIPPRTLNARWQKLASLGMLAVFALVILFPASPGGAIGTDDGDAVTAELVAPTFSPGAVHSESVRTAPACASSDETAEPAAQSTCHAYAKPDKGGCCATVENRTCCGKWCGDGDLLQ